ncbi:MAG: hypothetical protein Fur0032_20610 [Terrimicrobiaceae bacterium]
MSGFDPVTVARELVASLPEGGLFHEKSWRVSPEPLILGDEVVGQLEKLGHHLAVFQRACGQLYRMSADGRQPGWIAELLDRGKPKSLIEAQRCKALANEVPGVIRPDIILTPGGFAIAELDSVPGGIGLTAWMAEYYSTWFPTVLGGASGMLDGFASIVPAGDIVISDEAATYRPEMEWLAGRLNTRGGGPWRVLDTGAGQDWAETVYRFFELFDLGNVPCSQELMALAGQGRLRVTPPFKPALEEKLWFALFWLRPLESFWERALGGRTLRALREVIPYTWLVDPQPLPPHAVLPGLEAHSWEEVAGFSQKQRDLILKISGFSDKAWGSRGVVLGSDLSSTAWKDAIGHAMASWEHSPHVMQRFHHARVVEHPWLDGDTIRVMRGRVRLCPYYFVPDEKNVRLGGALATICPENKKLLHGMSDAILTTAAA